MGNDAWCENCQHAISQIDHQKSSSFICSSEVSSIRFVRFFSVGDDLRRSANEERWFGNERRNRTKFATPSFGRCSVTTTANGQRRVGSRIVRSSISTRHRNARSSQRDDKRIEVNFARGIFIDLLLVRFHQRDELAGRRVYAFGEHQRSRENLRAVSGLRLPS